jgi:hypothetical protein
MSSVVYAQCICGLFVKNGDRSKHLFSTRHAEKWDKVYKDVLFAKKTPELRAVKKGVWEHPVLGLVYGTLPV